MRKETKLNWNIKKNLGEFNRLVNFIHIHKHKYLYY